MSIRERMLDLLEQDEAPGEERDEQDEMSELIRYVVLGAKASGLTDADQVVAALKTLATRKKALLAKELKKMGSSASRAKGVERELRKSL
jgi:hypothetical protein